MTKREYEVPETELIYFQNIDIITTSDENEGPMITVPGEDGEDEDW